MIFPGFFIFYFRWCCFFKKKTVLLYHQLNITTMTRTETKELTLNKKVKAMIANALTTKKHVAGIGYVFYFNGGFVTRENGQMIITIK